MKARNRLWMLAAGAAILISGHGLVLYYVSSHLALSSAIVAGVAALVAIKHLGLVGPLYAIWRKAWRRSCHPQEAKANSSLQTSTCTRNTGLRNTGLKARGTRASAPGRLKAGNS